MEVQTDDQRMNLDNIGFGIFTVSVGIEELFVMPYVENVRA